MNAFHSKIIHLKITNNSRETIQGIIVIFTNSLYQQEPLLDKNLSLIKIIAGFDYKLFYLPEIKDGGILFLSCLSFCKSVWNFNLANNFWTVKAKALIFRVFLARSFCGTNNFDGMILTLEFDLCFKNLNLAYYFWTVSSRALLFHMSILWDKTFL